MMIGMKRRWTLLVGLLLLGLLAVGCGGDAPKATAVPTTNPTTGVGVLSLPALTAVARPGEPLNVVATTSIIGDVVVQVGGEAIALTTLMEPGQDPHSYQPGARQLTAVANADVIFINGWDLEESLVQNLESVGEKAIIVPISANIQPLVFGAAGHDEADANEDEHEEGHEHEGADPHVWQAVTNVMQWVNNVQQTLSALDPANTAVYQQNATAYLAALAELEAYAQTQLAAIPAENRVLITNHDALAYFAHAYDFEILGTIIPGGSTLAESSATSLAALVSLMAEHGICTIFAENTSNTNLAAAVAAELKTCAGGVQVSQLYTDALGAPGSGADSYIGMFRANVDAVVKGLR
ncbi:MAG: zinc ABC transporter solute-binding protein [Chloroflexi bacterium]|nr:zinc ABC transporter substrate-binding protein [Ardenticatenaceae bacterium]NOG34075.1 zinc ABC transporter solute-binding protein [Chloroflexota bacterium]GIK54493.1 MAG: ABC transporter substrate-binding protein [Chloroflexota bacterium]